MVRIGLTKFVTHRVVCLAGKFYSKHRYQTPLTDQYPWLFKEYLTNCDLLAISLLKRFLACFTVLPGIFHLLLLTEHWSSLVLGMDIIVIFFPTAQMVIIKVQAC